MAQSAVVSCQHSRPKHRCKVPRALYAGTHSNSGSTRERAPACSNQTCANTNTPLARRGRSLCLAILTVGTLCMASQHVGCATVRTRLRGFRYSVVATSIRWRNRRSPGTREAPGRGRGGLRKMYTFVRAILLTALTDAASGVAVTQRIR
jgi:hypothetical protein